MGSSSSLAAFTLSSTSSSPKIHFFKLPPPSSFPSLPKPSLLLSLSRSSQSPILRAIPHVSSTPPPPTPPSPSPSTRARLRTTFLKFVSEKLVVLVLGSFVFMASLGARPVLLALAASHRSGVEASRSEESDQAEHDSEALYLKVLEEDPRNVDALKVVLYGKMKKGEMKEAVVYVERLIRIQPGEAEWRLLQALCYETMGHLSKAKGLFKEVLKRSPLSLRALHGLAMVMHKNHEGPVVFDMLYKALEIAHREKRVSEERNIRILIAQMHVVKGELVEGLKNFQVLIDENPRDFRPYLCQGIVYSLLDKKREAEECFEIYHSLVPEEFPQRCFLDDVVLTAKTIPPGQLQREFKAENAYRK